MRKNKKTEKEEMISLNEKLFDNFFVEELEHRLETDPLMVGSLLEMDSSAESECFTCTCFLGNNCSEDS